MLDGEADIKNKKFKARIEFKDKINPMTSMKLQGFIEISDILKGNWSYENSGEETKEQGEILIRVILIFNQV